MKNLLYVLASFLPVPVLAGNLLSTCTAFDLENNYWLEAWCVINPANDQAQDDPVTSYQPSQPWQAFDMFPSHIDSPDMYPMREMRRTSIHLDHCVGVNAEGNLYLGGQDASQRCHNIGFNYTQGRPMLYGTCRTSAGEEVYSVPLDLSVGLYSVGGQLGCRVE
ncbi:MAG: hypothetical protein K9L82_11360 [Chromatiaceae bacterium]|nr:hypothetical protein [Chromatiaceae bacterium]MCF7995246.1 hypothetical protein [Chromatiaceae bacterium]MCF8004149.1 hypothetical protein [Chromatiaceae bacterium]